jgi:hypothetical protein
MSTQSYDRDRGSEPRYLTTSELERLLAEVDEKFWAIVALSALAGLRAGETLALLWGDIDFDAGTLNVRGRCETRTLALPPSLVRELTRHRERASTRDPGSVQADRLVFPPGQRLRPRIARAIWDAASAAGLNCKECRAIRPHDLRHSFIRRSLMAERQREPKAEDAMANDGARKGRRVDTGNRRIPGLYMRMRWDGAVIFEARVRLRGTLQRRRLAATTDTAAAAEFRAWIAVRRDELKGGGRDGH